MTGACSRSSAGGSAHRGRCRRTSCSPLSSSSLAFIDLDTQLLPRRSSTPLHRRRRHAAGGVRVDDQPERMRWAAIGAAGVSSRSSCIYAARPRRLRLRRRPPRAPCSAGTSAGKGCRSSRSGSSSASCSARRSGIALMVGRQAVRRTAVPFGPFLAAGALLDHRRRPAFVDGSLLRSEKGNLRWRCYLDRSTLGRYLQLVWDRGASDLHLTAGYPPVLRIDGQLDADRGRAKLLPPDVARMIRSMFTEDHWRSTSRRSSSTSRSAGRASAASAGTPTSSAARRRWPCAGSRSGSGRSRI